MQKTFAAKLDKSARFDGTTGETRKWLVAEMRNEIETSKRNETGMLIFPLFLFSTFSKLKKIKCTLL